MDPSSHILFPEPPVVPEPTKKCPDVPRLGSYRLPPDPAFWKKFPTSKLPSHPSSLINYRHLREIINWFRPSLTMGQAIRADKVLHDLQHGSTVPFTADLPEARIPNTPSVMANGESFTDTLAWWVRQGKIDVNPEICGFMKSQ